MTSTPTEYTLAGPHALPAACSYLETIGRTPMVRLSARSLPPAALANDVTVLCKLELQNPGGSLKDRIALNMIEGAEARGELRAGMTIIDFTSGNTGIGYAMVAAAKGYACIVVMPQVRAMLERYLIVRQFGAHVHLFNPALGAPGAIAYIQRLVAEQPAKYWWANQLGNVDNPDVHTATTGPEIWAQAGGKVDVFMHGIGTGGCVAGVGKFLKARNPACRVVALEPTESRVHVGAPPKPHAIVGWAPGVHSQFLDGHGQPAGALSDAPRGVVDEWGHVSAAEAVATARAITASEGMMVGPSSGAALKYALDIAARPESRGQTIVVVIPSHGIRYVAHPLWATVSAEAASALPPALVPCADKEAPIILWSSEARSAEETK